VIRRLPGLDGLRGIAVLAVIIYHADVSLLVGGFLGVDVFFVLSGFLITSLLLEELQRTNQVDRAKFYLRRIRRLMPALFMVLLFSVLISGLFVLDAAYHVRRDLPWAITFVLNWSYLFFEQSYFVNISRPPLLQHLWSLSVEEQFYVIWPLLLVALYKLPLGRITPRAKVFITSTTLALASTAWMVHLSIATGFPIPNDPPLIPPSSTENKVTRGQTDNKSEDKESQKEAKSAKDKKPKTVSIVVSDELKNKTTTHASTYWGFCRCGSK
jgi:peptidoglycan/LPS O-acetylase OafA/YrhL